MSASAPPMPPETLDEASETAEPFARERRALAAAVAEARADPRPDVPHETVRPEMLAELAELEKQIAAPPAAKDAHP